MPSKIEWTQETWSPWIGCTPISDGCDNCWAKREEDGRFRHLERCVDPDRDRQLLVNPAHGDGEYFWRGPVYQGDTRLKGPLHWRKGRTIFVCPRSDLYHEDISFEQVDRVFAVMALCPQHKFLVLTKRAERMAETLTATDRFNNREQLVARAAAHIGFNVLGHGFAWDPRGPDKWRYRNAKDVSLRRQWPGWPLPNVGLGVTICNQAEADAKIPKLLACPAAMRFLSVEPTLEAVNVIRPASVTMGQFRTHKGKRQVQLLYKGGLDWVIVGCESGKNRRPCELEWVRSIVEQCKAAGVACFVKQISVDGKVSHDPAEWPADLRVRELPEMLRKDAEATP